MFELSIGMRPLLLPVPLNGCVDKKKESVKTDFAIRPQGIATLLA
jgi:hypothetical protein